MCPPAISLVGFTPLGGASSTLTTNSLPSFHANDPTWSCTDTRSSVGVRPPSAVGSRRSAVGGPPGLPTPRGDPAHCLLPAGSSPSPLTPPLPPHGRPGTSAGGTSSTVWRRASARALI